MTKPLSASEPAALRKARALWAANRFDEAAELFESTAAAHPDNIPALVDAARALGHRQEVRKAEALLERLAKAADQREDLLFLMGQTWRMIFREDLAIECLEKFIATRQGKRHADAHFELAVLYERRHRVDDCAEAVRRVLNVNPQYMEALILLARLYRRSGETSRAETALRRVTKNARAHPMTQAQAWAALADLADKQGDYEGAVTRMEKGKEILRAHAEVPLKHSRVVLGQLEAFGRSMTPEVWRRWAAEPPEPAARVAQLTSFPRSGTTLLENVLDAHPDLVSSEEREIFGRDLLGIMWKEPTESLPPTVEAFDRISREKLSLLRRRYLGAMEEALGQPLGHRLHIDKNPTHTLFLPALWRLFPETRFLIALRDPRDVVVSCYFQHLPLNPQSVCFLSWESTAQRFALDMGLWLHFRNQMPADAWRETRYEDLVGDLPTTAKGICEFLGVGWDESVLRYREAMSAKTVHSPTYLDVAQPIHRRAIGRWRNYQRWLEPHWETLRPIASALGYDGT